MTVRLPDFLIIGAMKSGTTSLFRWLDDLPDVSVATMKEPDFFARDDAWARGLDWYGQLFAHVPAAALTGEASTSYTGRNSRVAAERIAATVPAVKLVYVVRDPVERMRSHYRHELQRGRERRAFTEAVSDVDVPYVDLSLYWERLGPYVDAFPPRQLSVVRFEDLVSDEAPGWDQVLDHLGLSRTARPEVPYNITVDKPQFSKLLLRQWQRNRLAWTRPLPPRARRMGKRLMTRNGRRYRTLLDQSVTAPLPVSIEAALADDAARLADWLGRTAPLW